MNITDHISEILKTIFKLEILKFFDGDPYSGWKKSAPGCYPGSATLFYSLRDIMHGFIHLFLIVLGDLLKFSTYPFSFDSF
jgi:hypothetical protein